MKHVVIYKEQDRYCSFPHVVYLPNGSLAVAFRKASKFSSDAAKKGVATHHDPDSSIELVISHDDGLSWEAQSRTIYKSAYGVNDPSLTVCRDGSLLLRFVALEIQETRKSPKIDRKIFSHRAEHGLVTTVIGNMLLKSEDSGASWQELAVADTETLANSCSRDPVLELEDGSLLMPVYTGAPQRSDISWVIRSFDQGKTWHEPIVIMSDPRGAQSQLQGLNFNETSLLNLGRGEILALVRADGTFHTSGEEFMPVGGIGEMYTSRSYDGGLSWESGKRTGFFGQPGALTKLSDGSILATYGYRKSPFGVRCCLSRDNGHTWLVDQEYIVRDDAPTWDGGYPFTIQLKNGRLFTVYYITDSEGTRYVAGSHWDLT